MKLQLQVGFIGAVFILCQTGLASEALRTVQLDTMSKKETILKNTAKSSSRQNEEKFPAVEKLSKDGWFSVDIKPFCNINIFSDKGAVCAVNFPFMPLGKQIYYGVPVQVISPDENSNKTALVLPSKTLLSNALPYSVEIPVSRKAKVLYFLIASYYTSSNGDQYFQINYQNGAVRKIPVVGEAQTGDWYHANTRIYNKDTHYVLVPAEKDSKTIFRNLHLLQWENPTPDEPVKSITFKTDPTAQMAIFVVGVSGHSGQ